jgi:HK97 gp10 family phage protein
MSDVRVIGAAKIMGELATITGNLMGQRAEACLRACYVFERRAKWYASGNSGGPQVQTGTLRSSIQSRKTAADEAQVAPSAEYAAFVEYGTSRAGAFPYMAPAYESGKDEAGKVLAAHLAACVSFGKAGGSLTGPASPAEG